MPKNREDRVQWTQLRRESQETRWSMDDKHNEPTMTNIMSYLHKEDSVTIEPLRLVSINKLLDQSQKYEWVSAGIKPHTNRAFIQDTFHHPTITHDYDHLPPDISISQFQPVTEEEDMDDTHEDTDNDDCDRKVNPTADENDTTIKVDTINRVVEEYYVMEDLEENEGHDDQLPVRPLRKIPSALAHYKDELAATDKANHDEEIAAALTANGIKFAATSSHH